MNRFSWIIQISCQYNIFLFHERERVNGVSLNSKSVLWFALDFSLHLFSLSCKSTARMDYTREKKKIQKRKIEIRQETSIRKNKRWKICCYIATVKSADISFCFFTFDCVAFSSIENKFIELTKIFKKIIELLYIKIQTSNWLQWNIYFPLEANDKRQKTKK